MNDTTQNKISKMYQILSGRIPNKRADYPLFEWDTLLDFFLAFYDSFCDSSLNNKEKTIGMFNKLYAQNVKELKNLRISKNDFEMIKTIGKGHFGEVIVVKEKNTSNVYAMKVLKKAATLSQDNMAFFFEERDIMAFANSEWVTSLHYAFQDYESLYLVMEFLPGGDLLSLLNRYDDSIVDEDTCKFYLSEIIIATNCIHKIGYVHRDIKPENILIDLTGHIKLADFGSAAKLINGKQVFGKMPVGTPEYIAPEVLTSMDSGGGKYGAACDYWSIGVVAYEMLFGMLPFEADSVLQLYNQIMNFEKTLEFPDDIEIKQDTKDLICGLICDQNKRFTYNKLAQHDFFKNLDWTTIKNMPPPYVPVVTSRTDTSNFDDINTSSTALIGANKSIAKSSKGFSSANTLPFVGFTFTRSLQQQLQDDIMRNMNSMNSRKFSLNANDGEDSSVNISNVNSLCIHDSPNKSTTDMMINEFKIMSSELENSRKEVEKIKKDLLASQSEVTRVENDKNFFLTELEKLKVRYKELSHKYDEALLKNENIGHQGAKLLSELVSIFDGYQYNESEDPIESVKNIKTAYVKLKKEKDDYEIKIQELMSDISLLNHKIELLTKNIHENEDRYNSTCIELRETITSLQDKLKKSYDESHSIILKLKQCASEDQHKIELMTEELEQLKLKASKQQEQDPKLLGVLQSDLNTANTSVNFLTSENAKLNEKLEEVNDLNHKLKTKVSSLESRLEHTTKDYKALEHNSVKLKSTISDKNMTISNLSENLSALERAKVELVCKLELLTVRLKSKEQLQSELETKIDDLKIEIEKHKQKDNDEVQQLTSQLRSANNKITSLGEELEDKISSEIFYKNSLENSQAELAKLNEEIKRIELVNIDLESEVKKFKEVIHTQKVSNYSLTEMVEKLKDDVTSANAESIQISNEFEEFKNRSREENYRLSETVKQQEKLIEFLQTMNVGKKKPFKSDSKEESYYSAVDHSSRIKNQLLARANHSCSDKLKNKSLDYEKEKNNFRKGKNVVFNSTAKDAIDLSALSKSSSLYSDSKFHGECGIKSTNQADICIAGTSSSPRNSTGQNVYTTPLKLDHGRNSINTSTTVGLEFSHTLSETKSKLETRSVNSNLNEILPSSLSSKNQISNRTSLVEGTPISVTDSSGMCLEPPPSTLQAGSEDALNIDPSKHQIVSRLNLFKNICMVCYNVIQFGCIFSMCKNCCLKCHSECMDNIFVVCNSITYEWFSYIPTIQFCKQYFFSEKDYTIPAMGWINTLTKVVKTKTEWEQRFMVVTNDKLLFFKEKKIASNISNMVANDPDLIDSYQFLPGEFSVHINMLTSDTLTYAGTTDSKTYWSIEMPSKFNTIGRKKKAVCASLFFSSTLQDKVYWIAMLTNIFNQYTKYNKKVQINSHRVHLVEKLDTEKMSAVCLSLTLNNDIALIATYDDLFIYNANGSTISNNNINVSNYSSGSNSSNSKGSHLLKINGFNYAAGITQIKDIVFVICGKSRSLFKVDTKFFVNEFKSKAPTVYDVNKFVFSPQYAQCHLIKSGKCQGEKYIAVAVGVRLLLFKLSSSNPIIDITLESFIRNIHFTSLGILYQTDVIRILNVKSGERKNFLDANDPSLAVQIFGQKSSYNYLLDVFTLKSKKNHEEFLLCYSELGVFVNKDGQRSRKYDITWVDVPTEFHMVSKNLLVVCYFDRIDAYDLSEFSPNSSSDYLVRVSYPVLSPTIIHHTSNSIHVCATDVSGTFGIYKLDLP